MGRQSSDFEGGLALYSGAVADNTERIDGVDGCSSTDGDSLEDPNMSSSFSTRIENGCGSTFYIR